MGSRFLEERFDADSELNTPFTCEGGFDWEEEARKAQTDKEKAAFRVGPK
jgi:hypothetical protein